MNFGFLLAIFPHRRSSWRGKSRTLGPKAGCVPTGDQAPLPRALVASHALLPPKSYLFGARAVRRTDSAKLFWGGLLLSTIFMCNSL